MMNSAENYYLYTGLSTNKTAVITLCVRQIEKVVQRKRYTTYSGLYKSETPYIVLANSKQKGLCANTAPIAPKSLPLGEFQQQVSSHRYVAMKSDCGAEFFKDYFMAIDIYKNLSGQSGVSAYELLDMGIVIQFSDQSHYTYLSAKVGANHISEMKRLAAAGKGLNSFINCTPVVKNGFSQKGRGWL